jgi:periplasmic protein TonB
MIDTVQNEDTLTTRGFLAGAGFVAALLLFIAIPLIQAISTGLKDPNRINELSINLPPPPVLELDTPPPPKKEDQKEDIEMEKEPPRLSLDQLDLALNPSTGDMMAGFALDLSLDADSLGTSDLIFDIEDVEDKPRPIRQIAPVYPPQLKRQRIEGTVNIVFIVDQVGNVIAPRVEHSTHPEFEKPALDAIRRWKFTPGKKGGEEVRVRVRAPLVFRVQ